MDLGGMLGWQEPHCRFFRDVLTHPTLVPYYCALLGEGYRLDHQPQVIAQDSGSEGFVLHGGPLEEGGKPSPTLQYKCMNEHMWTSLLAVSVQLVDHNPGDGGFAVLRGSHKLNFPVPRDFAAGDADGFADHIFKPTTAAGDVVLFSEATVHGAVPWCGRHQRRIALYRFAPANMGYGRGYLEVPDYEGLTEAERAVLAPPYAGCRFWSQNI